MRKEQKAMRFGEKLKELRKKRGMSQKELAVKIGTTSRSVINYEKGKRLPGSVETVLHIANTLGVSPDYLINDDALQTGTDTSEVHLLSELEKVIGIFKSGKLEDEQMRSFMTRLQTIYSQRKKSV